MGFHRGAGRGGGPQRGSGGPPHQAFRGRGVGRGNFQPGRLEPAKEKLKFDSDYDFDKANEEFKVAACEASIVSPIPYRLQIVSNTYTSLADFSYLLEKEIKG